MILPPPFVPPDTVFYGVGVGHGVAIGPVHIIHSIKIRHSRYKLTSTSMIEPEIKRLREARQSTHQKLSAAQEALPAELLSKDGDIFSTHLMLLNDPYLFTQTEKMIKEKRLNAEAALVATFDQYIKTISSFENEYLKSRLYDLETISNSLVSALQEREDGNRVSIQEGSVVVSLELNPSEVASLPPGLVRGIVTERGSQTSHSALVAQAIGIPMVVGVQGILGVLEHGDLLVVDAIEGHVIHNPDRDATNFYKSRKSAQDSYKVEINRCAHLPALTLDDHKVAVMGNLELVEELPAIMTSGGEGIGLYRTEFMYLTKQALPTEEELFGIYRRVVETAHPRPVVIRTLDLGADKIMGITGSEGSKQSQALGLRAIRFCLKHLDIFRTQLRAILRASVFGRLSVMLPMISSLDEIRMTKEILADTAEGLTREGHGISPGIPIGIMIEVPAAVSLVDELAAEADFLSIGTNDLIQYSLALDRTNPDVADLYQPFHPSILRMVKATIDAGRARGLSVSVCGDMAAEPTSAPILVGFGADTLSMPSGSIPTIKRIIRMSSYEEIKQIADEILTLSTTEESKKLIRGHLKNRFRELDLPILTR
ncbi:MAG: phosphoenolpyruvate--protein phosphotransferase [Deltaproteobacteria bacterium]|jgi:phosphotransferase system enzyme I (PtsI)|nr:phosphoenolpyruvate--protein phosphotransferase [Deltaproteobacteria bacterium]